MDGTVSRGIDEPLELFKATARQIWPVDRINDEVVVLGVRVVREEVAEGRKDLREALGFENFQNCLYSNQFAGDRGEGGALRSSLQVNVS